MTIDYDSLDNLIDIALKEDSVAFDVTALSCVGADLSAAARIYSKESLVFCGGPVLERILNNTQADISLLFCEEEGRSVEENATLVDLRGNARDLLKVERVALNFMQRLSGVASHTKSFVEAAHPINVFDTRKTTPGWRSLEKYAVTVGKGKNHRMSLGDMIMVKDNHIDANGGDLEATLSSVFKNKPKGIKVEVEVRDLEELDKALNFPVDIVMLDNIRGATLIEAVAKIRDIAKDIVIEASGNVSIETLPEFKEAQVDYVSSSRITAGAMPVDIAMSISYT